MDVGTAVSAARNNFRPLADKIEAVVTPELFHTARRAGNGDAAAKDVLRAAANDLKMAAQPFEVMRESRDVSVGVQRIMGPAVNVAHDAANLIGRMDAVRFNAGFSEHPLLAIAGRLRSVANNGSRDAH